MNHRGSLSAGPVDRASQGPFCPAHSLTGRKLHGPSDAVHRGVGFPYRRRSAGSWRRTRGTLGRRAVGAASSHSVRDQAGACDRDVGDKR